MSSRIKFSSGLLLFFSFVCGALSAAERPTLVRTNDPRPDILPRPLYQAHTEYRRAYNRPQYFSGWIARWISPTSQEAMVWYENKLAGSYDRPHMPPRYKRYFVAKPWEALQTGARPDFPESASKLNPAYDAPRRLADDPEQLEEIRQVPEVPDAVLP